MNSSPPSQRIALLAQTDIDVAACRRYVLDRQTPSGGFCFYRYGPWGVEEPNAVDTGSAIASLVLLGCAVPRLNQVVAWLQGLQDHTGGYASLVIADATLGALHRLGLAPERDPRNYLQDAAAQIGLFDSRAHEWNGWLANAHCCLQWWHVHGLSLDQPRRMLPAILKVLEDPEGGFVASHPSVIETWHALRILSLLDQTLPQNALTFLRQCEHSVSGMTLTPGSTATSLEAQHAGARALRLYTAGVTQHAAIRRFTAACQTSGGGFARTPDALPNLIDTFRALAVLSQNTEGGDARVAGMD